MSCGIKCYFLFKNHLGFGDMQNVTIFKEENRLRVRFAQKRIIERKFQNALNERARMWNQSHPKLRCRIHPTLEVCLSRRALVKYLAQICVIQIISLKSTLGAHLDMELIANQIAKDAALSLTKKVPNMSTHGNLMRRILSYYYQL